MSFDVLADDDIARQQEKDWRFQASMARRLALDQKALTDQRSAFIRQHALKNPNSMGQGETKVLPCQQREALPIFFTERRKAEEALAVLPRYSARLLLEFRLLTPLLTKDDDPFYLFDNPVRKDHILGLPYLSAAALKGLAADAYQRAFPGNVNWQEKGQQAGVHDFRRDDENALRLFGIADDGANNLPSQIGRLHFSPLWFGSVQFLVMNPSKAETATGDKPIQFEAIAPDQASIIEMVYCNPYGVKDTDETHVRADLARFLAALAVWWPALGLGAKRLAGYGAIEIHNATVQAVGWTGLESVATGDTVKKLEIPDYVQVFLNDEGCLISEAELEDRLGFPGEAGEQLNNLNRGKAALQAKKQELQQNRQQLGKEADRQLKQVKKEIDKLNKQLEALRKPRQQEEQALRNRYRMASQWLEANPQARQQATAAVHQETASVIGERTETGPESWLTLARWIARVSD